PATTEASERTFALPDSCHTRFPSGNLSSRPPPPPPLTPSEETRTVSGPYPLGEFAHVHPVRTRTHSSATNGHARPRGHRHLAAFRPCGDLLCTADSRRWRPRRQDAHDRLAAQRQPRHRHPSWTPRIPRSRPPPLPPHPPQLRPPGQPNHPHRRLN